MSVRVKDSRVIEDGWGHRFIFDANGVQIIDSTVAPVSVRWFPRRSAEAFAQEIVAYYADIDAA